MAEQMRPSSSQNAPDPANSYERANPGREAGMGRLDNNMDATPTCCPDKMDQAVKNRQDGTRQQNAHDVVDQRRDGTVGRANSSNPGHVSQSQPDHSMKDEEPMGWDQAPTDIHNPRDQRQPKTGGKGGTP